MLTPSLEDTITFNGNKSQHHNWQQCYMGTINKAFKVKLYTVFGFFIA